MIQDLTPEFNSGRKLVRSFRDASQIIADSFSQPLRDKRPPDAELACALTNANREVHRLALEYARRLDEKPIVLAVWDGKRRTRRHRRCSRAVES